MSAAGLSIMKRKIDEAEEPRVRKEHNYIRFVEGLTSELWKDGNPPKNFENAAKFLKEEVEKARKDIGNNAADQRLQDTLSGSFSMFKRFMPDKYMFSDDFEGLAKALVDNLTPPEFEDILDGQILDFEHSGNTPEIALVNKRYLPNTCQVKNPPDIEKGDRSANISIVLGPSGSGKTFFAVKEIPKPPRCDKKVTIYYNGSVHGNMEKKSVEDFATALCQQVQTRLEKKIKAASGEERVLDRMLDMIVTLVLDEAYVIRDWLDKYSNLEIIYNAMNFCEYPQLVIAGTGIDSVTNALSSSGEVWKFRMMPWTMESVTKVINSFDNNEEKKTKVQNAISRHPLLKSLTTNARSAFYLVEYLSKQALWQGELNNVGWIVEQVARKYISQNGLADLLMEERCSLVRAVFNAIKKSSEDKKPEFPCPPDGDRIRSCFYSMIDIHVETIEGKITYLGAYVNSISVTSAITMVLLTLLGVAAKFGTNWSEFEVLCAMREIQHLVMTMEEDDLRSNGVKLLTLDKPFPPTATKTNFEIPCLASNMVAVNGMRAPFADVIAPYRLCQCKYTENPCTGSKVTLNRMEFIKMGIVKTVNATNDTVESMESVELQEKANLKMNLVLALDRVGWSKSLQDMTVTTLDNSGTSTSETKKGEPSEHGPCYPIEQLLQGGIFPSDRPDYILLEKRDKSLKTNKEIIAVFYTNAAAFAIGKRVNISCSDTNRDGSVSQEISEEIEKELQVDFYENVKLQFLFFKSQ